MSLGCLDFWDGVTPAPASRSHVEPPFNTPFPHSKVITGNNENFTVWELSNWKYARLGSVVE